MSRISWKHAPGVEDAVDPEQRLQDVLYVRHLRDLEQIPHLDYAVGMAHRVRRKHVYARVGQRVDNITQKGSWRSRASIKTST